MLRSRRKNFCARSITLVGSTARSHTLAVRCIEKGPPGGVRERLLGATWRWGSGCALKTSRVSCCLITLSSSSAPTSLSRSISAISGRICFWVSSRSCSRVWAGTKRAVAERRRHPVTRLALLLGGNEVDNLRFRLHLANEIADLFLRQLGLGEADAVELAFQRSLNHGGLVGTKKLGDVIRGRLRGKAHDRIGAFARGAGQPRVARTALLFNHYCGNHGRLHQDRNGGRGCGPGKRARSKAREKLRDAAAEVEPAPVARRPRLLGIDCGEQPLHRPRRWRTECLIQVDRLDKLLANQIILPCQFAVAGQRLLHAISVTGAQRPGRVPRQGSFYLLMLRLLVYRVHGQPLSIPSDLSSSASRLRA